MKIVEKMTAVLQFCILSMDPPLHFPWLQFTGEMYSASFALKVKINIPAGTSLQYFLWDILTTEELYQKCSSKHLNQVLMQTFQMGERMFDEGRMIGRSQGGKWRHEFVDLGFDPFSH